ncbi:MAG: LysR family transcriptional regulator [Acidimicrobiales bacterium]|jgi:DNA-binding transcriptional LysR family regulator
MELRQLRSLLAVGDHGSFSSAASALDTVQSNVSSHISKLESEINAVLVDRRTGTLTEQGQLVAQHARNILIEIESIYSDLSSLKHDVQGRVRVGIIGTTARWLIPVLSEQMSVSHPKLKVEYLEATSSSLLRWVHDEVLDIAILNAPVLQHDITFRTLFEEIMMVTVPKSSPLATQTSVSVRDLEKVELIVPPKGSWFRDELDAVAAKNRVQLSTKLEIDGLRLIAALSEDGHGAAVVPATSVSPSTRASMAVIPIVDLAPRKVGLARRKNRIESAATKALVLSLSEIFTNHQSILPVGVSSLR